jgi:two-component system sensor histidine kinase/response regulator
MRFPSPLQTYSVAIGVVLLAFVLRYGLYGTLDHRIPFGFFLSATIIAAWYGGLGPGLFAAVAGLLLGDYFFLPRHATGTVMGEAERTAIGLYALNCALVVLLFWRLHMRLAQAAHELKKPDPAAKQPAK